MQTFCTAIAKCDWNQWRIFPAALLALLFLISCEKPADPSPKPQAPPPFEFLGVWGDKGQGPGKLDAPIAFAPDSLGHIFFADPAAGFVHKFESKGTPLLSFEDSRVRHASGIAVDSGGAIYILDAQRGTILIFFPDGTFLRALSSAPQRTFSGALGISTDDQGNLYVPDPAKLRVLKFDNRGRLVKTWPAPQKAASTDERPSWVSAAADGTVFVAYFKTGRVEKFSSDGSWITTWTAANTSSTETDALASLAIAGEVVLTLAPSSPEIRVWTSDGQNKLDVNLGENLGTIAAPQIAVTPQAELLVFDPSAPKVFRFRMHLRDGESK
jgi:hypothetical protein